MNILLITLLGWFALTGFVYFVGAKTTHKRLQDEGLAFFKASWRGCVFVSVVILCSVALHHSQC